MIIAEFLVGSIDDAGYIRLKNDEIIDDLALHKILTLMKIKF